MNTLLITDNKTVKRNVTDVQAALLMMYGIDYTKDGDKLVFTVDYSDGYLFDIKATVKRILS